MSVSEGAVAIPEASNQDSTPSPGATLSPSAGISSRGHIRRMRQAMQDSIAQHDFYGNQGMHYMGNRALSNTPQDAEEEFIHLHDSHLELQERMLHPIAFHA